MDNITFCKSFGFLSLNFSHYRYTDKRSGTVCHHIGYLKRGRAEIVTDSEKLTLSEGDVFFIPTGCRYRSYWYGDEEISFDSYGFTSYPSRMEKNFRLQKLSLSGKAAALLAKLTECKGESCESVGLFLLLLAELLPVMEEAERNPKTAIVDKAKGYIFSHDDFSVGELAKYCRISETGLYAAFREVAGSTPVAEKHKAKIEKAIRLLRFTDMSVEEISDMLGFSSAIYFRKILRRYSGKTPRQIRNDNLQ